MSEEENILPTWSELLHRASVSGQLKGMKELYVYVSDNVDLGKCDNKCLSIMKEYIDLRECEEGLE